MKILFLTQRVPCPPDRGDRITTYNFIKHLSEKHEIHLLSFTQEEKDSEKSEVLNRYCKSTRFLKIGRWKAILNSLIGLLTLRPFSVSVYCSMEMKTAIKQMIKEDEIELIYAYSSNMCHFIENIPDKIKICHIADLDSCKWENLLHNSKNILKKLLFFYEWKRVRSLEKRLSKKEKYFVFSAETEKAKFEKIYGHKNINYVIENGVDLGYFDPSIKYLAGIEKEQALIFTGVLNYYPNIESVTSFIGEAFPLILKEIPDINFYIVGKDPSREIRGLKNREHMIIIENPDDVRGYFMKAKVAVVYMKSAQGMQNKILEALAMGIPVVSTESCYLGIAKNGSAGGVEVGRTAEEFAAKVARLIKEDKYRTEKSIEGRRFVEQHYSWQRSFDKLDSLIDRTVSADSKH
jgi:sugar transferase (PEP-CTERM/EpsH1 system associated)